VKLEFFIEELPERDVREGEIPLFRVRVRNDNGASGGFLNVVEERVSRLSRCRGDFFDVLERVRWRPNTQYLGRVQNVYLASSLRGKGVGSKLYLAAALHAKELGLVLCADACAGGETSRAAERVYERPWLRDHAVVSGLVFAAR
jgi:GNAT superfamily N-acetyltransferase